MNEKKVVVITGASSGIGEATAKILAKSGMKIVLGARRENKLQALAKEVESLGGEAAYAVTDVTDVNQVEALAKLAKDKFGRLDVWLNSAGIMPQAPLKHKDIADWDATIDINVKGTLYGIGAALPYMEAQESGHIINIASIAGLFAHAGGAVYHASKWAVRAISESLREEMAQDGGKVRVTVVSPGAINTELLGSVSDDGTKANLEDFYKQYGISADRVALTIKQAIDLPADADWNEVVIRPTNQVM